MTLFFSLIKIFSFHFLLFGSINCSTDKIEKERILTKNNQESLNDLIYIESFNDKMTFITSFKKDNSTIYIATNSENSGCKKRLVYIINANAKENNYFYDYKIMYVGTETRNIYPLMTWLKIENNEYLVSLSNEGDFELIEYFNGAIYSTQFFNVFLQNSYIHKNTFMNLNYYNYTDYVLNAYVDKNNSFTLNKLYYLQKDINGIGKINVAKINVENAYSNSVVTCFEFDIFIECLYTNSEYLYKIAIFKISDLNHVYNETIEENPVEKQELFSKCIYIKNNVGAFIYFTANNYYPTLKFKIFLINNGEYQLKDYIEPININSRDIFSLGNHYLFNDIIKINENTIAYVNTKIESTQIYIIMIKLLNDDKNVLLKYYKIKLNENYNIQIYKDITVFTLNELLGIGMTNYNYDMSSDNTYSSFFLIGNYTLSKNFTIQNDDFIFNEESEIKINDIIKINNNIFGYFCGIKILSLLDEKNNGFYIISTSQNRKIKTNDYIYSNDTIKFKKSSDIGIKLGQYSIEYIVIVKEEEYDNFISDGNYTEFFPDNSLDYKLYFQPIILFEKKQYFNFTINKCYYTCESCTILGNIFNHQCQTCSTSYPYFYSNNSGNFCLEECPENHLPNKMNICKNMQNKCKKLFYIDEYLNINCIEGNNCIDEYPHLDENNENMCTNCLVKYKDNCFFECPANTCIKQGMHLNECIDIGNNTKVINKICFDNFEDLTKNIKNISNKIIQDTPDLKVYSYDIDNDSNDYSENKLTYINFKSIKDRIIEAFNLDGNATIYTLLVDSKSKYSNSTINDFDFVLLLENGTELDLSLIDKDIKVNVSIPVINSELVNYNYAVELNEQGYDIYDKNSKFYHDICTPGYLDDNDIRLAERQQEIFPNNVTIRKSNCEYKISDLINKRFLYECNITDNKNSKNEIDNFEKEEDDNYSFKNYILDIINYKILNCSMLLSDLNNYRHNKAVMISSTCIFLSVLLFIIFLCTGLKKIRILLYEEIPSSDHLEKLRTLQKKKVIVRNLENFNSSQSNPTKRNKTKTIEKSSKALIKKSRQKDKRRSKLSINYKISNNSNSQQKRLVDGGGSLSFVKSKKQKITKKPLIKNNKDVEYDDIPLSMALKIDKRNIFYFFGRKIIEKIEIIDIFVNKKIKSILLSKFILLLLIELTMNALLYSDSIVSHKKHNDGRLDFIVVI